MKKIPLSVKIIVPIMVIVMACGVFFGIKLINTNSLFTLKEYQVKNVEAIAPAEKVTTYNKQKSLLEYETHEYDPYKDAVATYKYKDTMFISYSNEWNEKDLADLQIELYKNTHGDEIYLLDEVAVYNNDNYDDGFENYEIQTEYFSIESKLYGMLPTDFCFYLPDTISAISIEYGEYFLP